MLAALLLACVIGEHASRNDHAIVTPSRCSRLKSLALNAITFPDFTADKLDRKLLFNQQHQPAWSQLSQTRESC